MKKSQFPLFFLAYLAIMAFLSACNEQDKDSANADQIKIDAFSKPQPMVGLFVLSLEKAHNAAEYRKHENVRFEVTTDFGEMEKVHAIITMSTTQKDVKIENDDGTYLVYEESTTSLQEDSIMHNFERFKHFAWAHFFSLPKRLRNEYVRVENFEGSSLLGDESFRVRRIRLVPRPGHDDLFEWYVVYADRSTGLLRYAGYGLPSEIYESKNALSHSVEYSDYDLVEGIPIAQRWTFWEWNTETGLGKKLGESRLKNISFPEVAEDYYK
ncbi:hypothetical protein G3O08_15975 [Cryomorpha ignava]|uniref:DUF4292 domain-containing protein n=1 Tax=Cryomorpha ignava TaxID=101383 RepID=A0A7K3WTI4_9FLAO|nr:hypothetical protein [Cryomorpha ignava]NEN24999.1 hypothetical protein [Cryomorpha ignava]